jgi:hypothetical protein
MINIYFSFIMTHQQAIKNIKTTWVNIIKSRWYIVSNNICKECAPKNDFYSSKDKKTVDLFAYISLYPLVCKIILFMPSNI